jgi:tRNA (guanine-N7-)-methyltransferase
MSLVDWYKVEQLPWPTDWAALFGRSAPLRVEIGFGSGLFLVHLARTYPADNALGIEISLPALRHAARKVGRAGLDNVRLLQGDASAALHALCRPGDITAVTINFPDPWPKKGHHGRRLIDDDFLRLLATRMPPGGALDIATDHDDYAEQITECLLHSTHFDSRLDAPYTLADLERMPTKYESVALAEGRTPRYYRWRRNDAPAEDAFPIPQELPMPHVVLRGPADLDEIGRRFRPGSVEFGSTRVRTIEAYRSLHEGKLLIETYIGEEPIWQRIGLEVRARHSGELVVALAEMGFPRPTRGVHLAIHALVEWLREEFPATIVVHSTLQVNHADTTDKRD